MTIRPDLIEKLRAKRAKLTENVSPEKLEALHAKGSGLRRSLMRALSRNLASTLRTRRPPLAWRDAFYRRTA
jgi:hypothetical protein